MDGSLAGEPSPPPPGQGADPRRDDVLRDVVSGCQDAVEPQGFQLDGRGRSPLASWVRFRRPHQPSGGRRSTELLLLAHGSADHTLLADLYAVDPILDVYTPQRKLVHRYSAGADVGGAVRLMVDAVRDWA